MRIIDQLGCDYPYESIVISHGDGNIYARPVASMDKRYLLAQYSSQEKAQKAMQMLHECYTGMLYMRNVDFGKDVDVKERLKESMRQGIGFITVFGTEENVKIEPMNIVFRFPQEDEV